MFSLVQYFVPTVEESNNTYPPFFIFYTAILITNMSSALITTVSAISTLTTFTNPLLSSPTLNLINQVNKLSLDLIIAAISTTTKSITGAISYIYNLDSSMTSVSFIKQSLINLDLDFLVGVIARLTLEQEHNTQEHNTQNNMQDSIKHALDGVNNILTDINKELIILKDAITYHNSKYFVSWRSLDCSSSINLLTSYKNILNSRYNILCNLLQIYKK